MIEQLPVNLEDYSFTANCHKCSAILFQIRIIDQFIRSKSSKDKQYSKDGAKFYLLHQSIAPSSLSIQKSASLNKTQPFLHLYIQNLRCCSCQQILGFKLLSASSEMPNYELVGRIFINVNNVRIKTDKQDVTNQVTDRFYEQWGQQSDKDQLQLTGSQFKTKKNQVKPKHQTKQNDKAQNNKNKTKKVTKKQSKKEQQKSLQQNQQKQARQKQISYLRRQLQTTKQQHMQIMQEIIASFDFFNQIIENLQKRVSAVENVCMATKDKIENIIPLLRKKNQQKEK